MNTVILSTVAHNGRKARSEVTLSEAMTLCNSHKFKEIDIYAQIDHVKSVRSQYITASKSGEIITLHRNNSGNYKLLVCLDLENGE